MREDDITRSLGRLLGAQTLSSRAAKQADTVYDALTRPKRVTVMGPPKSGKSDLMALLAGKRVVPADVSLGTICLVHGEHAHTVMDMPDGSTQELDGVPSAATMDGGASPLKTTIAVPLPALKKVNLMRLAEANTLEDQSKAMAWAADQSDIVIWCTTRFAMIEKTMWALMPDRVRDHAFVLRTSLVAFDHNIATARSDLGRRVGDEFAFVLAADLKVALAAQVSVPIDTDGMKKSGATTIISALLKEIDLGRQNAINQAELILAKYPAPKETEEEVAIAALYAAKPEPVAEPQPASEIPVAVAPPAAPRKDSFDDVIGDLAGDRPETAGTAARPTPSARRKDRTLFPVFETSPAKPEVVATESHVEPSPVEAVDVLPALSEDTIAVCKDMVVRLSKLGVPDTDQRGYRGLFDAGLKTLSWIDDALMDVANDDAPRVTDLQQKIEEATDLIQLLRLEDDDTAALDAATILLQMKRSVHSVLAA